MYDGSTSVLARTLLVFLLAALSCAGQDLPGFAIFLRFDTPPSALFVRTMKQELSAVFSGFDLHWISKSDTVAASKTYRHAFMVRFSGRCGVVSSDTTLEPGVRIQLGDSITADGSVLPYSEVNCDNVLAFLQTADFAEVGREARLGRASGRVLAHELYHVLLKTSEHSSRGLAKAVYTPAALLAQSLQFEEGELQKMASFSKP